MLYKLPYQLLSNMLQCLQCNFWSQIEGLSLNLRNAFTIECHNLLKWSVLCPLNHFSCLAQNLLNESATISWAKRICTQYVIRVTFLSYNFVLRLIWFNYLFIVSFISKLYLHSFVHHFTFDIIMEWISTGFKFHKLMHAVPVLFPGYSFHCL